MSTGASHPILNESLLRGLTGEGRGEAGIVYSDILDKTTLSQNEISTQDLFFKYPYTLSATFKIIICEDLYDKTLYGTYCIHIKINFLILLPRIRFRGGCRQDLCQVGEFEQKEWTSCV